MLLSLSITGCNDTDAVAYEGESLRIDVIGEMPIVQEETIVFTPVEFTELERDDFSNSINGDALFIMPEQLVEASNDNFIEKYKELNRPIFFIGTTKGHIPFIFEDADYEGTADVFPKSYAAGYLYDSYNQTEQTWVFTSEDEKELTEQDIQAIYSDIFRTIDGLVY